MDFDKFVNIKLKANERRALKAFNKDKPLHIPTLTNAQKLLLEIGLIHEVVYTTDAGGFPVRSGQYSITPNGRFYLRYSAHDRRRFWIPVSISLFALAIAAISLAMQIL